MRGRVQEEIHQRLDKFDDLRGLEEIVVGKKRGRQEEERQEERGKFHKSVKKYGKKEQDSRDHKKRREEKQDYKLSLIHI